MRTKIKVAFFRAVIFMFLGASCSLTTAPAWGAKKPVITDDLIDRYDNYQIYFYNAEQKNCIERGGEGGDPENPGNGEWDGHCSNINTYAPKIEQYFDYIYSVAQNNGLPWEGIVAQLIGESSFMSREACAFNPLGLKGSPSCDGKHRIFSSYEEAFNYYVNSIRPVREAMGKFKNDPYGYIVFLIHGVPGYKYATDPEYINKISGHVCGVQKWAKEHGKPISGNAPSGSGGGSGSGTVGGNEASLPYCDDDGGGGGDDQDPSSLIFYLQCDPRWGNLNYGPSGARGNDGSDSTICKTGCGPTSFAVIAANLKKDKNITPDKTADLAGRAGMHVPGTGSSWGITRYLAGQYGLTAKQIPGTIASIDEYLKNGYMIHTSGRGAPPFSTGGHYIAIVKAKDGKWLVGDSGSRRTGPSRWYDPATVMAGMNANNVWAVK